MKRVLIVVDMQNDFINGALGTKEAEAILPRVEELVSTFDGHVVFTRDTHYENYLETQEGTLLPVRHCICGTDGWELAKSLQPYAAEVIDKPAFGSPELGAYLLDLQNREGIEEILLVGLCTDICVISNALLVKAFLPEIPVAVDASCCAGVTPESHRNALSAMSLCQIRVING